MPFTTLNKKLIIEASSSSKKASSSSKKASSSSKKASSSSKKASSSHNKAVPIQEEIDRYINNKLLNAKKGKSAIIMVGGPGSGKSSGIKVLLNMTKKIR